MRNVDLSVIVLTFNQEKYIKQTIKSIVEQETRFSFEVIVGDDCSTDKTREILVELSEKYSEIQLLFNDSNLGVVRNYCNALQRASGRYIMECGGDDYWLQGKIECQLEYMINNPQIGLVHAGVKIVDKDDNGIKEIIKHKKYTDYTNLIINNEIYAVSVCFKKKLWEQYECEVKPIEKEWLMEDYPFWLWISKHCVIGYISEVLCAYRILVGSLSRQRSIEKQVKFQSSAHEVRKFFANKEDLNKIESLYLNNLSNVYLCNDDLETYKKIISKDSSLKGRVKLLLSCFPGFLWLYNFRKKLKSKE